MSATLLFTGCAEQDYVSDTARSFLKIHEDYGLSNEQVAMENLELQTNENAYLLTPFDVKDVKAGELEKLNEFDFTGPANTGIDETNGGAVAASETDAMSKGFIYLIPLGIKGGTNGMIASGSDWIEKYANATEDAKKADMGIGCFDNPSVKQHSEMSDTEWKSHLETLKDKAESAIGNTSITQEDSMAIREWCYFTETGTMFDKKYTTSNGGKYFILTKNAINLMKQDGFGITASKDILSGYAQYSVNYQIAAHVQRKLENAGYTVSMSRQSEDEATGKKDFSSFMTAASEAKAAVVVGTNCINSGKFHFTAQYADKNSSTKCRSLADSIVDAVKSASGDSRIKIIGIGDEQDSKGVRKISRNFFLNQQREAFPLVYCECGSFHEDVYGKDSDTVKKTISEYGDAIASGILKWMG